MAYVWKGTTPPASGVPEKAPVPFDPSKCGEARGYKQHRNHGQEPCQPCKDGAAAYRRAWVAARKGRTIVRGFNPDKCGTRAGYAGHTYHKVPYCDPCRAANAAHSAELRQESRAA